MTCPRRVFLVVGLAVMGAACASTPVVENDEPRFSRAELIADLDAFVRFVGDTHPDLARSADPARLDALEIAVRDASPATATLREAWMALAVMNPGFGDAHTGLRRPADAFTAYQEAGGAPFPASVVIDAAGAIRVAPGGAEGSAVSAGEEIVAINGIPAADIVATLQTRMRGETPALARLIMARFFAEYFWTAYGGFDRYVVRVRGDDGMRRVTLREPADREAPSYAFRMLDDRVAYIDAPSFAIDVRDDVAVFLANAFEQIQVRGAEALIIDLRRNTGGAHDVSDLLMNYLTDAPYSAISGITARVAAENIDRLPGARLGDVVRVPFAQTIEPDADNPLRFDGDVYVLVGALTYSQAIVFAATVQDHGIGTIAGEETEGPANQTGQVQTLRLPHTGLQALAPLYVFTRASGEDSALGVRPEIAIADDPFDPDAGVRALLDVALARGAGRH